MKGVRITVVAKNADQQKLLGTLLGKIAQEFPQTEIEVTPESKKLIPGEIVLIIAINITSTIATGVLLRILDKLWEGLHQEDIQVKSSTLDQIQQKTENYLKAKNIVGFRIIKREDRGLYVRLTYKTTTSFHMFNVSKSDLEIIKYEEREPT